MRGLATLSLTSLGIVGALATVAESQDATDLIEKGRQLAEEHCIRCHVVKEDNPFSGIGSTPSFRLLVTALPDWLERFETFHARRPHPAIVRFEGIAPPTDNPPANRTVDLRIEDIDAIVAFAISLRQQYEAEGMVEESR
jgi:mono/diheme cytochrome c family protein